MNRDIAAIEDAYLNVERVGVMAAFKNAVTEKTFTLRYELDVRPDGYILPLTGKFVRYGDKLDEETKRMELAMIVKLISRSNPQQLYARNILHGIISEKLLKELRESVKNN